MTDTPIHLTDTLYLLGGVVPIDRRTTWVSQKASGWTAVNCYALIGPDVTIIIDTGVPLHETAILQQIEALPDTRGADIHLLLSRCVEFDSLGNAAAIAHSYPVSTVYAHFDLHGWLSFHPRFDDNSLLPTGFSQRLTYRVFEHESRLAFSAGATTRVLTILHAPLRLLATAWVFDETTGVLFTSDAFGHVSLASADAPRIVDESTDATTFDRVRDHLFSKFDWLLTANTAPIHDQLTRIFTSYDVKAIAPAHGCVIMGRDLVAHHVDMLQTALREVDEARYAPTEAAPLAAT